MGVTLLVVAPALWGLALVQLRDLRRGTLMQAKVTGHSSYVDGGRDMYSAKFAVTIDGRTIEGTSGTAKSWISPAVGAMVPVRYRPGVEPPLRDVSGTAYVVPMVCAIMGTFIAAVGVSVLMGGNPSWW
jgi:hypothetical protein